MAKNVGHQAQYRLVDDLVELEGNPRTITKSDFEKLKTSIKNNPDYFEARPLILSNRTGELVVLAGNQRLKAAKALGLAEVPTVLLEGLSEEREKEIVIRDNVENGDWDFDALANKWDTDQLMDWGVKIRAFSDVDLDNFFEDAGDNKEASSKKNKCPNCGFEF